MSASPTTAHPLNNPPPAPPLPPSRLGPLQRFIAPLSGLAKPTRSATDHLSDRPQPPTRPLARPPHGADGSRSAVQHRTGIPIAAIDINRGKTHAVLAGKDILKTVRVEDGKASEDINLRSSIQSYVSRHGATEGDAAKRRRDYLPARDVKWSTGQLFPNIIATAAANGRLALYDVDAAGSRIELAWLHDHTAQVNKIDIDPFQGRYLLSASQDQTVKLWDIREPRAGKAKSRFDVRSGVRHVCWSPKDGNDFDFAVCADGGLVQNWDIRSQLAPKVSIHAHDKGCYSLDWHPDGRHVVSGGFDKYVKAWDFKSNNRRQKPTFQFRVSQAIRSVCWRPASEQYYRGTWQSTQVATTYHHDDARVHVWDLTRPHLPWLELSPTARPATDMLWASTDHIWTAGEEGVFTQFDVKALPQVSDTVSPSALMWLPGGDGAMFMEDRLSSNVRFDSEVFSGISKEKLLGQDDKDKSPQDEDDLDSSHRMSFASSIRQRQSRELSYRSDTSRTSSPPEKRHIQQLDKTVHAGRILHQTNQIGAIGRFPSAPENKEIACFLASNYASIATEEDRRASPATILSRLKDAFLNNAEVSEEAALYRMGQSWRMLAAVIIPELENWAKVNMEWRRLEVTRRQSLRKADRMSASDGSPAFAKVSARDRTSKLDSKENKIISNLFKGLKEPGRTEQDSSSNMTTPLARPLNDSPRRTPRQHRSKGSYSSLSVVDDLPALPPSLLNSHAVAAAASRALHSGGGDDSVSPMSSPEQPRATHVRSAAPEDGLLSPKQSLKAAEPLPRASPYLQAQKQEQKRNALRDYRAQARPIFSLDTQAPEADYSRNSQHDSAESFPMFSASTGSSHKARSMGQSVESKVNPEPVQRHDSWLSREDSSESPSITGKSNGGAVQSMRDFSMGSDVPQFNMDETPELKPEVMQIVDTSNEHGESLSYSEVAAISCSPDIFQFSNSQSPKKPKIHAYNPTLHSASAAAQLAVKAGVSAASDLTEDELKQDGLIFQDLRPIDIALYQPKTPFAWSAFPLLCQMIAYDVDSGVACCQLATHLLLHVAPYFFGPPSTKIIGPAPETLAERLMLPSCAQRCIETILRKHLAFLKQIKQSVPYAALRKACVEAGYDKNLFSSTPKPAERTIAPKEPNAVSIACSDCGSLMNQRRRVCDACHKAQALCPLCQRRRPPNKSISEDSTSSLPHLSSAWLTCQSCGHGAHHQCISRWLLRPSAEGVCFTNGCNCDCAPGLARDERIDRQRRIHEEQQLIHGSSTAAATKKDSLKASQSPAVDRARAVMRAASQDRKREVQSGDERGMSGAGRGAGPRSSARIGSGSAGVGPSSGSTTSAFGASSRKSVRLMAPGEEGS